MFYIASIVRHATFAALILLMTDGLCVTDDKEDRLADGALFDSVSIYAGQGVNHNFRELPSRVINSDLDWEKAYFHALGFGKAEKTLGKSFDILHETQFPSLFQGYEVVLVQHVGLQNNVEVGAAYTLKTSQLQVGLIEIDFSSGVGLSYAFGYPSYEDGAEDNPQRRYRLQILALFDFEWRLRKFENTSIIVRVHHRSGGYGLIAPTQVGSNFLVTGIRYKF